MEGAMGGGHVRTAKKKAVIASITKGVSRAAACEAASVGRRTFYNWMDADAAFRADVERAERENVGTVESVGLACALKAEVDPRYQTALIFWLKCNAGWKETQVVEVREHEGVRDERSDLIGRVEDLARKGGGEPAGA